MLADVEEYLELAKQEFFTLRIEWRLYRSLFGTNKETVDLLNDVSGPTAHTLERILFERCLLGIRRLNDNSNGKRGRRRTISVKGFLEMLSSETDLKCLVKVSGERGSFAKSWSDKRIAHADLLYRQGKASLETASREKVEEALDAIAAVLKHVASTYLDVTLVTHPIPPLNDERQFLERLYLGQRAADDRRDQRETFIAQRDWKALNRLESQQNAVPSWLRREEPPMDVD